MIYLKKAWNLWSDLVTFEWLRRLSLKRPRLGMAISGFLISTTLGLFAWYYLDPHFKLYERNSYAEVSWTFRIIMGTLLATGSIAVAICTVVSVKQGSPFIPDLPRLNCQAR